MFAYEPWFHLASWVTLYLRYESDSHRKGIILTRRLVSFKVSFNKRQFPPHYLLYLEYFHGGLTSFVNWSEKACYFLKELCSTSAPFVWENAWCAYSFVLHYPCACSTRFCSNIAKFQTWIFLNFKNLLMFALCYDVDLKH